MQIKLLRNVSFWYIWYILIHCILLLSCSVQFSCFLMSDTLRPQGLQHARLPWPSPTLEPAQTRICCVSDSIQPPHPLPSPSPPIFNLSQHQGVFQWVSSSHQVAKVLGVSASASVLPVRTDFLYDGLVGSPCNPRDSQESFPTPQCKSINSSVLGFLYSPALTSTHDSWKTHSFD